MIAFQITPLPGCATLCAIFILPAPNSLLCRKQLRAPVEIVTYKRSGRWLIVDVIGAPYLGFHSV